MTLVPPPPTDPLWLTRYARADVDSPPPAEVPTDPPVWPGYTVIGPAGRGGMGLLYYAIEHASGHIVVIKTPPVYATPSDHDRAAEHFLIEYKATLRLKGLPTTASVVGFVSGPRPGLALEHLGGGTLANRLSGPVSPDRAAEALTDVARALAVAHVRGVVHRNVSPANVMFRRPDWRAVLVDFGSARVTGLSPPADDHCPGTPVYLAPETILNPRRAGPLADVWAVGVTLYEALTGERPFAGATVGELFAAICDREPVPANERHPRVPGTLAAVCRVCLAKNPADRFQSADELAAALELWDRPERPPAPPADRAKHPPPDPTLVTIDLGNTNTTGVVWDSPVRSSPTDLPPTDVSIDLGPEPGAPPSTADESPPPLLWHRPVPAKPKAPPDARKWASSEVVGFDSWDPSETVGCAGSALPATPTTPTGGREPGSPAFPPVPMPAGRRLIDPRTWFRPRTDRVGCTVFAPPRVPAGDPLLVQVFVHLPKREAEARVLALQADPEADRRGGTVLTTAVRRQDDLAVHLSLPGFKLTANWERLTWVGSTVSVSFAAVAPMYPPGASGTVTLWRNGVPVGHVRFLIRVDAGRSVDRPQPVGRAVPYRKVFISYATEDRDRVLDRVQGILRYDPDVDLFMDILKTDPGERWERNLYRKIDECELFLLGWSAAARRSVWVRKELRHALARQQAGGGEDAPPAIRPLLLDGPPPPEPWDEMRPLHINDPLLYFHSRPGR